jgi:hypothetical protein
LFENSQREVPKLKCQFSIWKLERSSSTVLEVCLARTFNSGNITEDMLWRSLNLSHVGFQKILVSKGVKMSVNTQ